MFVKFYLFEPVIDLWKQHDFSKPQQLCSFPVCLSVCISSESNFMYFIWQNLDNNKYLQVNMSFQSFFFLFSLHHPKLIFSD